MVYGKNIIDYKEFDINAPRNSDAYIMALMAKFFPGSWLPYGSEMVLGTASKFFNMINISSGRLDYIETTTQWRKKIRRFNLRKYALFLRLLPLYLFNKEMRYKLTFFLVKANMKCFQRELLDHFRIVFEKKETIDA